MEENEDWFLSIWQERERDLYPSLFGSESASIFPIPWERLQAGGITDPRWNTCGVLKFSPTSSRSSWLYVTSGLSNAWFDDAPNPTDVSGFGCEFVLEANEDSDWPIQRLHQLMVFHIAICCGRYPDTQPFGFYDTVPADSPINWKSGNRTIVMLVPPASAPEEFSQRSGSALFLGVTAITPEEMAFARENSKPALLEKLVNAGAFPVVDPDRTSVV